MREQTRSPTPSPANAGQIGECLRVEMPVAKLGAAALAEGLKDGNEKTRNRDDKTMQPYFGTVIKMKNKHDVSPQ